MHDIVQMALESIRANKVQSGLTVLGVVIGVATVIGMSSVISGLDSAITDQVMGLGTDLIFVTRVAPTVGQRTQDERTRPFLTFEDADAIHDLSSVRSAVPMVRRRAFGAGPVLRYLDRTVAGTVIEGATPEHEDVFNLDIRDGRWITRADHLRRTDVVVLGHDAAETLFLDPDRAVGREVDLVGHVFVVVGVLEKRPNNLTPGANPEDNYAAIPITTFRHMYPSVEDIQIVLRPAAADAMDVTIDQVEGQLRRRRGVRYDEANNFAVFTQDAIVDLWNQVSNGIFALMLSISSVGLIVGGVGVMNIMLVSVTERTREIGVRKAIGATRHKIMIQFLLEAVALTSIGGVIGILLGFAVAAGIRTVAPFLPADVSAFWVVAGFLTSTATGLVSGVYPAYKAALLDPIEALRYE